MPKIEYESFIEYSDELGKAHREDGPAVIWKHSNSEEYYFHGVRHRLTGPAVTLQSSFGPVYHWWVNGIEVTDEINEWAKKLNIDLNNLSDDDKTLIAIKFADWKPGHVA